MHAVLLGAGLISQQQFSPSNDKCRQYSKEFSSIAGGM
jgi:hypothetical protein